MLGGPKKQSSFAKNNDFGGLKKSCGSKE